jgi:hypothetical protein
MSQLTRKQIAEKLTAHYAAKFPNRGKYRGQVWVTYDPSRRMYELRGEGLAPHPDLEAQHPNGWGLLDYIAPAKARAMLTQEAK